MFLSLCPDRAELTYSSLPVEGSPGGGDLGCLLDHDGAATAQPGASPAAAGAAEVQEAGTSDRVWALLREVWRKRERKGEWRSSARTAKGGRELMRDTT